MDRKKIHNAKFYGVTPFRKYLGWPFEEKLIYINYTQLVPHREHSVFTITTNLLMLYKETMAVYCENLMAQTNILCSQTTDL
jgi:hypothetical protein